MQREEDGMANIFSDMAKDEWNKLGQAMAADEIVSVALWGPCGFALNT